MIKRSVRVHHLSRSPSLEVRKYLKTMETQTKIPVLKKSKVTIEKRQTKASSSCCAPKTNAAVCCAPGEKPEDNNGACCAQPEDGSSCCDK